MLKHPYHVVHGHKTGFPRKCQILRETEKFCFPVFPRTGISETLTLRTLTHRIGEISFRRHSQLLSVIKWNMPSMNFRIDVSWCQHWSAHNESPGGSVAIASVVQSPRQQVAACRWRCRCRFLCERWAHPSQKKPVTTDFGPVAELLGYTCIAK